MANPSASPAFLDGFDLSRDECESIVMQARLKAGWITEADLVKPAPKRRSNRTRGSVR